MSVKLSALTMGPPCDYSVLSPDGEYVFVMLVPEGVPRMNENRNHEAGERMESLRSVYPQSGLYRQGDHDTPLWTVDWFAEDVLPCSDGVHLIRFGFGASKHQDEAIAFFANGDLLKSYRLDELVHSPEQLPQTVLGYQWRSEGSLVSNEECFQLSTVSGERYKFDVASGRIIESFKAVRWTKSAVKELGVFLMLLVFSWLVWSLWKRFSRAV